MIKSHSQIIDLWPAQTALAIDINVPIMTVRQWKTRSSIPAGHWKALVHNAVGRNIPLTYEMLAEAAAAHQTHKAG